MRTRHVPLPLSLGTAIIVSASLAAPAQAMPTTPEVRAVASAPTSVGVPQMKKAKKVSKKKACKRIYFSGKPSRPTAVKVWCNGGKTLVKLKTKGLKPGTKGSRSSMRYFNVTKGSYSDFAVFFVKRPGSKKGELRVYYQQGGKDGLVVRNPWKQTPKQSRVVV